MHFLLNEAEENHLKNQMKYIREKKRIVVAQIKLKELLLSLDKRCRISNILI